MKEIEKIIGVSVNDLKVAIPAITEGYSRLRKEYLEKSHPRLKVLDQLIVFSLATFVI